HLGIPRGAAALWPARRVTRHRRLVDGRIAIKLCNRPDHCRGRWFHGNGAARPMAAAGGDGMMPAVSGAHSGRSRNARRAQALPGTVSLALSFASLLGWRLAAGAPLRIAAFALLAPVRLGFFAVCLGSGARIGLVTRLALAAHFFLATLGAFLFLVLGAF